MIDVVFALGRGSFWNDNELLYSLRSIERHLKNYRNIYIIGSVPRFAHQNLIFNARTEDSQYPALNILNKIDIACNTDDISEDFLFFNDDHFLLQDFDATQFPYFYESELRNHLTNTTNYAYTVLNTIRALEEKSLPTRNFDVHTPIIYNKKKFVDVMYQFDWNVPHALCIKSLYCNALKISGVYEIDGKIKLAKNEEQLRYLFEKYKIFSIDDAALNHILKRKFQSLYPEKSKYEI